jgi:hypothetical protein
VYNLIEVISSSTVAVALVPCVSLLPICCLFVTEETTDKPGINLTPTTYEPGTNDTPTTDQPGNNDTPTVDESGTNYTPTTDEPGVYQP